MSKHDRSLVATLFSWNDLIWSLLACFMFTTVVLVTQINKTKSADKTDDEITAGNISVYVFWKDGVDADIDTHLASPDGEHIWYNRLSGKVWNLLRDDLGMAMDTGDRNFENAYARGLPAGDYVVNVHAYRGSDGVYPVVVDGEIRVTFNPDAGKGGQLILKQKVTLYRTGEEATLARFSIDGEGHVVPGSVNHIFKSLLRPQ